MNEFEWQRQLRELKQPREPQHDLWAGIAAGIAGSQPAKRRRVRQPWAWAVAASAVLALGALLLGGQTDRVGPAPDLALTGPGQTTLAADGVRRPLAPPLARTALDWAAPGEKHLTGAARELDSATAELQQAIEMRPDAVFLVGLLNRTNAQRMRLTRLSATAG